jgi:hypothetical protein
MASILVVQSPRAPVAPARTRFFLLFFAAALIAVADAACSLMRRKTHAGGSSRASPGAIRSGRRLLANLHAA